MTIGLDLKHKFFLEKKFNKKVCLFPFRFESGEWIFPLQTYYVRYGFDRNGSKYIIEYISKEEYFFRKLQGCIDDTVY